MQIKHMDRSRPVCQSEQGLLQWEALALNTVSAPTFISALRVPDAQAKTLCAQKHKH